MKARPRTASRLLALLAGVTMLGVGARAAVVSGSPDTEANVARVTAHLLESSQFSHHPLDATFAERLLNGYFDALDPSRSTLLKSDVDEFSSHEEALARAIHERGDTSLAGKIFARYLERSKQRLTYVKRVLDHERFDFTGHDRIPVDREHAARPAGLGAAEHLWHEALRAEYLDAKLSGTEAKQIKQRLLHRYEQRLATARSLRTEEVDELYLNVLAHVYDPHSDYLGHEELESLAIDMNLSLVGIGASLEDVDGECRIRAVIPGGPAAKSGALHAGDRIVAVAQADAPFVPVAGQPLTRTVELIRGRRGSTVRLQYRPAGAPDGALPKTAVLLRDQVELIDQRAKARIVDLPQGDGSVRRIGVLELPSFYADMNASGHGEKRSATADVAVLLRKLRTEHVQSLVLDLRGNGGGSLREAIALTGLFIPTGPVVQTRDANGDVESLDDRDPAVAYDGPLVVLTNRASASASEILAGALKDYGRAVIVGDTQTFGKGTVQNIVPLGPIMDRARLAHTPDPGALKLTIEKFYRPSGASTQLRGVAADIVLPSPTDQEQLSESSLKDPLPWDTVRSAAYNSLNRVSPYLTALRTRSAERVAASRGFQLLAEQSKRLKAELDKKYVGLNEGDRRRELADEKSRERARATVLDELRKHAPASYVLSVADASHSGLPARVTDTGDRASGPSSATAPSSAGENHAAEAGALVLGEAERIAADYADLVSSPRPGAHARRAALGSSR